MAANISYDDRNLQRLFAEMDVKRRTQSLKGAFRREANQVRKVAVNNLRSTGIRTDRNLEAGIRALVFKRKAGFRVTIAARKADKNGKGEYGMHTNRRGLKKPILIWAEQGTDKRKTKNQTRIFKRSRKGHPTGRMRRYGFMQQTQREVANTVTNDLRREIVNNTLRVAKKYGCK